MEADHACDCRSRAETDSDLERMSDPVLISATALRSPRAICAAASAAIWDAASRAAADFWDQVASHARVSAEFRDLARENRRAIDKWRELARRLPR